MKPIRVAFSGSGFKASAHVGALCAVHDAGFDVVEFSGTSGGSIVAALAAAGMSPPDMRALVLDMDWSSMLTFNPWSALTKLGYCSGSALLDWLTARTDGKTFRELDVGLTVMASDLNAMAPAEFSAIRTPDVPVALAVRASTAIPFVYAPVTIAGHIFAASKDAVCVDGGLVNNIPADKLLPGPVPRIGVQLVSQTTPLPEDGLTLQSMVSRVIGLMLSSQESTHVDLDKYLGVKMIFVETGYANGLDTRMPRETRQRLYDDGYAAAKAVLTKMESPAAVT